MQPKFERGDQMKKKMFTLALVVVMMAALSACGGYYRVTDPTSDKVYYTQKVKAEKSGAVMFKDAKTDSDVTLQNSEVEKISKDEFKVNTMAEDAKKE